MTAPLPPAKMLGPVWMVLTVSAVYVWLALLEKSVKQVQISLSTGAISPACFITSVSILTTITTC